MTSRILYIMFLNTLSIIQLKEKDPHDIQVTKENGFQAEFKVGIIRTAKTKVESLLKDKYEGIILKENASIKKLTSKQLCEINKRSSSEAKNVCMIVWIIAYKSIPC